jgi:glycosyltransferase involved in cell wall biosynthesis
MRKTRVVVVVPAHNESGRVRAVVSKVARLVNWVVAVDDGSTDGTSEELSLIRRKNVVLLRLPTNCGKGAAMRAGFLYARRFLKPETIVAIDADGQHNQNDLPRLVAELRNRKLDLLVGCRSSRREMPLVKRFGNSVIRNAAKVLFGVSVSDPLSGYRVFGKRALELDWKSPGYSVEMEVLAEAGRRKLLVGENSIETIYNDKYKGTDVLSGVKIVLDMVKWRLFGW